MSERGFVRTYWRIILLVLFVAAAVFALFVPGGIMADDSLAGGSETVDDGDPTNLQYGLGLDGGTRISAPVVGMTAENIDAGAVNEEEGTVDTDRLRAIETTLLEELELSGADARVDYHEGDQAVHAEVFSNEVDRNEFAAALQAAGVEVEADDIRDGVTDETREEIVRTVETRINEAGLAGGQATQQAMLGDDYYIVVEAPDMTPSELRELLSHRGAVEVVAHYPENGEQLNETVLEQGDFQNIDPATYDSERGHHVPVSVRSDAAPGFQEAMNEKGFTAEGVGNCAVTDRETGEIDFDRDPPNYCMVTVVDGEPVDAHSMGDLAEGMQSGEWANDPSFIMGAQNQPDAQSLSVNLRAGALPADLDFDRDDTFMVAPALADQFKTYSLLIGILSVLTVSGMVYLRYSDVRVAAPMIVTALAEVVILLGFAALIRMPLDLSHIAGFIAVIGTGVDDLIIIADEVMSEGDVSQQRVFDSRFRKAFWVIGAAAATTIIALSPLAVLSLGDLRGFAIITILGVLVGVLVTRPAYGDILRYLLTDDK